MSGPRVASSVSSTLGGWTVSPLTSSTPWPNRWRAHQSEYALFQISALSLKTSSSVTPWRSSSAALRSSTALAA